MNLLRRLVRCLRGETRDELYLCGAADLAELERRMRALERSSSGGSFFVTFNH